MHTSTNPSFSKHVHLGGVARWLFSASVVLASLHAAVAAPQYAVTALPLPAGYQDCAPYQINDQGFVVGCATRTGDPNGPVATVWKNGTVSILGKLKDGTYSIANAINSKGVIVGEGDDGDGRPLGWITSGSKLANFFSNNGGNTHPIAINDAGDVSGYFIKGFSSVWRGGIWKVDAKDPRKSTLFTLPVLPGGDPATASAIPFAFNKSNEAAGWSSNSAIGQHAAFWKNDAAHSIVDLGVFGSDWTSVGNSLNDLGQVVGTSQPPFGSRPVMWDSNPAHTAFELPLLPGHNYGSANLINNSATIVGFSAISEPGTWNVGPSQLVIWIDGTVYDLQSLLAPASQDWQILQLMSINNPGQIAAVAMRNGVVTGVVLTPIP